MVGWVYAFVTPSMPGIAKFGATERDPTERLREANACTWHMHEYAIAAAQEVDDPFAVERAIHAMLASRRVHPRREFFSRHLRRGKRAPRARRPGRLRRCMRRVNRARSGRWGNRRRWTRV